MAGNTPGLIVPKTFPEDFDIQLTAALLATLQHDELVAWLKRSEKSENFQSNTAIQNQIISTILLYQPKTETDIVEDHEETLHDWLLQQTRLTEQKISETVRTIAQGVGPTTTKKASDLSNRLRRMRHGN